MKITIVGAGNLGAALGRRWAAAGHAVTFAVKDPAAGDDAVTGGLPSGARLAAVEGAAAGAEVVVLAVPAMAVDGVLDALGPLDGVVLADATNPVGPGFRLRTFDDGASQAERIQARVPAARVVKAFNQTGFGNVADPFAYGRPVLFVAGDDEAARAAALALSADLGFEAVDAGPLVRARELEHLAMLWIALSASPAAGVGRDFAFTLQRKERGS